MSSIADIDLSKQNIEGKQDFSTNGENSPVEKCIQKVTSSIKKRLDTHPADPSKSYTVCIYKVSAKHRKVNEEAYTPRLISIGPLHHGKSEFQAMEAYKLSCLRSFLIRYGFTLDNLVAFAAKEERDVRGCYEDTTMFTTDKFSELILLDGIFVVQLFLKNHSLQDRDKSDAILENQWMQSDILHDMLLLENQLPISFIQGIFNFVKFEIGREQNLTALALEYFKNVGKVTSNNGRPLLPKNCSSARHFVEFLVYFHWPSQQSGTIKFDEEGQRSVTLDLTKEGHPSGTRKVEFTRSATELQEAGVVFESTDSNCIFDVSFQDGVLKIPKLTVNDATETFLRNSIAFEQCGYYDKYLTSYVIFMDSLIDTPKDVELLVKHNIINNLFGENQQVADLFNNLHKEVITNVQDFYFAAHCEKLNAFSKDYWHEWKAIRFKWKIILKRDYFSNPWSSLAVAAAVFALVLTVIQTVCALISV